MNKATYSKGTGGAFGVRSRTDKCAVVDCPNPPKAQICFYDGARHRHGAIHYNRDGEAGLEFHKDGWFRICDEHYEHLKRHRHEI
jgi:hypothetical protein